METALKIENLNFKYHKRNVLNNINFETYTGEVFGLLGPNGAGKTTLIKLITGLLAVQDGQISIFDSSLEKNYEKAMANLGAIVENPEMYKYMTGYQNIMQYARIRGVSSERIDQIVELVGLKDRIKDKVSHYSLGMRQRLGLALALLHNPKLLILDEPTNGLDPAGIKQLRDILIELAHKNNICVIVSSHLMSEMEMMCDRVAIIKSGSVLTVSSLDNLLSKEGGDSYIYEYKVSSSKNAAEIISSSEIPVQIELKNEDTFTITIQSSNYRQTAAEITKLLVNKDISIYSMTQIQTQNLEDAFIKITNLNKNGGEMNA